MNEQIREQAEMVKEQRGLVARERQKMVNETLNPRIFEHYEMTLRKMEQDLCTLVIEQLEKDGEL